MKTYKFQEILDDLSGLDNWLLAIGIPPSDDRIHWAIEQMRFATNAFNEFRKTKQPTKIGTATDYPFALVEALEFRDVLKAFQHEPPKALKGKLSRVLNGPQKPSDETKADNEPRNTMFELALAAEWKLKGLEVAIGEPDITLRIKEVPFFVECKRPFTKYSVRANIGDAAKKLGKKLDADGNESCMGIVSISVSRLLNPGTKVFIAPTEKDMEILGDEVQKIQFEHAKFWDKGTFHDRVIALIYHIATVTEIQGTLSRSTYSVITPRQGGGPAFNLLSDALRTIY